MAVTHQLRYKFRTSPTTATQGTPFLVFTYDRFCTKPLKAYWAIFFNHRRTSATVCTAPEDQTPGGGGAEYEGESPMVAMNGDSITYLHHSEDPSLERLFVRRAMAEVESLRRSHGIRGTAKDVARVFSQERVSSTSFVEVTAMCSSTFRAGWAD